MQSIFVTGAGGFIGQTFLRRLRASPDYSVKALVRRPSPQGPSQGPQFQQAIGDLLNPASYRAALAECDTVVHLAAVTGRAPPADYERVNVEGTRLLLEACREAGVRRFLHVSTIAAGYVDQRYYAYARSKLRAEALVRECKFDYAVVRPTLVLGQNSPIWQTLLKIANLPVVPLPQGRRPVRVQPIHADDVCRGIELLLESGRFQGEVLELGGPRSFTFAEFLGLVQAALHGRARKIVPVPLWPLRTLLATAEPVLRPLMPLTAGQLAVFANDSTASDNWLQTRLRPGMPSTEETIEALVDARDGETTSGPDRLPSRRQPRPLSQRAKTLLNRECHTFAACLVGAAPSAYVRDQYARAAHAHGLAFDADFTRFDRVALALARSSPLLARCADAHCALFHRSGALRRKLIVLAAILEHVAPTNEAFDHVQLRHASVALLVVVLHSVMFALSLLLGAIVLAPASILCWIANALDGPKRTREAH